MSFARFARVASALRPKIILDPPTVALYLLDEASSGTTPTTADDDVGLNHLTCDYDSGNGQWGSNSEGNGFECVDTVGNGGLSIVDHTAAGSIGGQLNGLKKFSAAWSSRVDAGAGAAHRVWSLSKSGGNGEFAVAVSNDAITIRVGFDSGGGFLSLSNFGSEAYGLHSFVVNVDTTLSTNRVKMYIDGSLYGQGNGTVPQDEVLTTQVSDMGFVILNRHGGGRQVDGVMFYFEFLAGVLSTDQITSFDAAMGSSNDARWR